jgi:hypothetical protein
VKVPKQVHDDDWETDYREWERELSRLEEKIARHVRRPNLNVLEKAGADRKKVLRLLALATIDWPAESRDWAEETRNKKELLKSLARRMETLAGHAKDRAEDPLSNVRMWAFLVAGGATLGMKCPGPLSEEVTGVPIAISSIRALAKVFRNEADRFGRFLRAYARRDIGVVLFLVGLYNHIGKRGRLKIYTEAAWLLTEAFEANGKRKSFSPEGLEKTFKRHAKPMLVLWAQHTVARNLPAPGNRFIDRVFEAGTRT